MQRTALSTRAHLLVCLLASLIVVGFGLVWFGLTFGRTKMGLYLLAAQHGSLST